jgi:hypothetical protein
MKFREKIMFESKQSMSYRTAASGLIHLQLWSPHTKKETERKKNKIFNHELKFPNEIPLNLQI